MPYNATNTPPSHVVIKQQFGLGRVGFEAIEVLMGLGLSKRQARVYFALLRFGDAKARALSGFASIERQEVYRILGELERLGLVKRCLTVPTLFSALPISQGTGRLIENRLAELNLLTKRSMRLQKKLSPIISSNPAADTSFGTVSEAKGGKTYQTAIETAQHRVQVLVGWVQFRQLCFQFEDALTGAIERGVMVEVLTEKPPLHSLPDWVKAALVKYPNFKLKITPEPPSSAMSVFDGARAVVALNHSCRFSRGSELWTEHPALVAACQALFWDRWDRCEFGDG